MRHTLKKQVSLFLMVFVGTSQLFAQGKAEVSDISDVISNTICNISWYRETSLDEIRNQVIGLRQQTDIREITCSENGDTPLSYAILGSDSVEKVDTLIVFLNLGVSDIMLQKNAWGNTALSLALDRFHLAKRAVDQSNVASPSSLGFLEYSTKNLIEQEQGRMSSLQEEYRVALQIKDLISVHACVATSRDYTFCRNTFGGPFGNTGNIGYESYTAEREQGTDLPSLYSYTFEPSSSYLGIVLLDLLRRIDRTNGVGTNNDVPSDRECPQYSFPAEVFELLTPILQESQSEAIIINIKRYGIEMALSRQEVELLRETMDCAKVATEPSWLEPAPCFMCPVDDDSVTELGPLDHYSIRPSSLYVQRRLLDLLGNIVNGLSLLVQRYKVDANGDGVIDIGAEVIIEECVEKTYYFPPEIFDMLEPILPQALNSSGERVVIDVDLVNSTGVEPFPLSHIAIYELRDILRCGRREATPAVDAGEADLGQDQDPAIDDEELSTPPAMPAPVPDGR